MRDGIMNGCRTDCPTSNGEGLVNGQRDGLYSSLPEDARGLRADVSMDGKRSQNRPKRAGKMKTRCA